MDTLAPFHQALYLNLETYRRDGSAVQTPVWFVQAGSRLYVRTLQHSGKVKRLRHTGRVRVAPCTVDGIPTGEWLPAQARLVTEADLAGQVSQWLSAKYGPLKEQLEAQNLAQGFTYAVIEIQL